MPELPEVETIRSGLEPLVVGRRVEQAWSHPSGKFTPARALVGRRFVDLRRRGKYLLAGLDDGTELVAHLGMTGSFVPGVGPDGEHVRSWWCFDDGTALAFRDIRRFGRLRVVPRGDHGTIPTLATLGPEPLDPGFTAEGLHEALRRSDRRLKTQLLSQRPVAGLGNIYADEALWLAGVSPARRRVAAPRSTVLHQAIVAVISQGIAHGGTTLRDYRTAEGATGTNQHHLRCYGRAGCPCLRCGAELRRRVIDGRTTTWCTRCQR